MLQVQQANKRLASFYQASCELVTQKTHGDIIHNVLRVIVETAGYEQANYFFYDHRNKKISLLNAVGFSEETMTTFREDLVFEIGESRGVVGYVAQALECVNITDTAKDERWIILDAAIQSALFAPVFYNENLFGVIAFFSKEINAFNEEDEQNIMALANSMAITFENRMKEEEVHRNNLLLEKRVSERTTQLELSNRDLEAFAQSVSYDLRVPLRAIEGYSRILKEACEKNLKMEETQMLDIINTNARKMDQLITDLLILSRSKGDALVLSPLDMTKMARQVYSEVSLAEEQEKISFILEELENTNGDPQLIHQVWASLLSKAVHYVLSTERAVIQITSKMDGEMIAYSICINSDEPEKIISIMQQQNQENPFGSAELGLSIVQQIIERHQGKVWVDGNADKGVTFSFSLPKA